MHAAETETDPTTVDTIVYALPEIVRGIYATRNDLSPGLRMPQLRALLRVARDEGLTMGDLARQLGVSFAAATQVVEQLVGLQLVTRERSEADRRVVRLKLTEQAHEQIDEAITRRSRQVREVCAQLSPEEARAFARGMELLGTVLMRDAVRATKETKEVAA
ncbi:MAG TPA: MarR family transcriptional regulator [Thermomicrobiales bacterium]|jgi:5'-methylthioadenosine phosphorylase